MSSTDNIIRVAIGGQGRSGYNIHASWLSKVPKQYKIVAVADQLVERRKDAREQFGARAYKDWKPMLKAGGFDLFVNALPTPHHVPASLAALKAGYHVICEKPMAASVRQFDRMVVSAKKNNRILAPFQNNRVQPFFDKIQEIVASGVLGQLVYVRSFWGGFRRRWDWQTWQDNMGGSLLNTGPHAVDQALALFGWNRTPKVFCRMNCNNPFGADADDHVTVTLYDTQRRAPQIDITISAYIAYPQGDMYSINGRYGGLSGNATQLKWRYFDPTAAPSQKMWNWSVDRKYNSEELPWVEEEWSLDNAKQQHAVGYTLTSFQSGPERIYNNIYNVINNKEKLLITPAQARKQIAVFEECLRQNKLPRSTKTKKSKTA